VAKTFGAPAPTTQAQPANEAAPSYPRISGGDNEPAEPELRKDAALPFVLLWQRGDYIATSDGVLPRLVVQPLVPGIGGVSRRRDGRFELGGLADDVRQGRRKILPLDLGYCIEISPGSDRWRPVWGQVVDGQIVEDETAYRRWCAARVADGTIPAPTATDLERIGEKLERVIAIDPSKGGHAREIPALQKQLDNVKAARAALEVA
jgi:hypothetical protein